jgi:hypothetical protein
VNRETSNRDNVEQKGDEVDMDQEPKTETRRVRYIERQTNIFGDFQDKDVDDFGDSEENELDKKAAVGAGDGDYTIAWRRTATKDPDEVGKRELLIQSQALRKALKSVLQGYPLSFDTEEVAVSAPYEIIYHNRIPLEKYAETADEITKVDINILLKEVEQVQSTERRDAETLAKSGQITFELLWTLFFPGRKVCQKYLGEEQVSIIAPAFDAPSKEKYSLVLWSIDYDGTNFKYLENRVSIRSFKGSKAIADLDVYPLENWKDPDGENPSKSPTIATLPYSNGFSR